MSSTFRMLSLEKENKNPRLHPLFADLLPNVNICVPAQRVLFFFLPFLSFSFFFYYELVHEFILRIWSPHLWKTSGFGRLQAELDNQPMFPPFIDGLPLSQFARFADSRWLASPSKYTRLDLIMLLILPSICFHFAPRPCIALEERRRRRGGVLFFREGGSHFVLLGAEAQLNPKSVWGGEETTWIKAHQKAPKLTNIYHFKMGIVFIFR